VQDKQTRFDLAIECGNLDVALEMATALNKTELWSRLASQALISQGQYNVVEKAYQRTKNFDKLSLFCLASGSFEKLVKMQKIAESRKDPMSKFHNALYTGDTAARIAVLREVGLRK
jgi:coatomer protein complex subunit alpha (xenin)